jgi:hypothetical protein
MHAMTITGDIRPAAPAPRRAVDRRGVASRSLIVVAVVVAAVSIVAVLLIRPDSFWLDACLGLGSLTLALLAFSTSWLLGHVGVSQPTGFVVSPGVGFVVPANRAWGFAVAGQVLMWAHLTGQVIGRWRDRAGPDASLAADDTLAAAYPVLILLLTGLVAVTVVTTLRGRPEVVLTPEALLVYGQFGRCRIPWVALRPGLPERGIGRRQLRLTLDRPELAVRQGLGWGRARRPRIPLYYVRVHPWFLADAIRYYVERPERRAAVGTPAEYERLLTAFGVPPVNRADPTTGSVTGPRDEA